MPFAITCPACRASCRLAEVVPGRTLPCPRCGQALLLTTPGAAAPQELGQAVPRPGWNAKTLLLVLVGAPLLVGWTVALTLYFSRSAPEGRQPSAGNGQEETTGGKVRPRAVGGQQPAADQGQGKQEAGDGKGSPAKGPADPSGKLAPLGAETQFTHLREALGNSARLAEVKGVRLEGTYRFLNTKQPDVKLTITWHALRKWRLDGSFSAPVGPGVREVTIATDGEQTWVRLDGKNYPVKKNAGEWGQYLFWMEAGELSTVTEKGAKLTVVGEKTVKDHPTLCVEPGWVQASLGAKLYFDRDTRLLVKAEYRGLAKDLWELYFSDYRETDGLKHWQRIEVFRDGAHEGDYEVTSVRYLRAVDDALFRRP